MDHSKQTTLTWLNLNLLKIYLLGLHLLLRHHSFFVIFCFITFLINASI